MGERFQYYIISRGKKDHITAIHDQWCYGIRALKYAKRLIDVFRNTDWNNMGGEIDEYTQTILSLRWHTEENKYFYHRVSIENMSYTPRNADSNHGCVIIDIRELKNIKAGFYTTNGEFITSEEFVKKEQKNVSEKYKMKPNELKKEIKANYDKSFDKLNQKNYDDLCSYMNELVKMQVVKRIEG